MFVLTFITSTENCNFLPPPKKLFTPRHHTHTHTHSQAAVVVSLVVKYTDYIHSGPQKSATLFWTITAMFPAGFLQCFYQWKQEWMLYWKVTKSAINFKCASPHYLLKLKPHKQRILKSAVTVFHHPTEEIGETFV